MDAISSTAFRKTYAKLTEPTIVTVNGHTIGTWLPTETWATPAELSRLNREADYENPNLLERFSTRPFTPVPKKGKRL